MRTLHIENACKCVGGRGGGGIKTFMFCVGTKWVTPSNFIVKVYLVRMMQFHFISSMI